MADTDQVLNLAAIIRKVDGNHSKGAAALAESILDHPGFRAVLAGEPAEPEGREPASVTGQPSDEELLKLAQQYSVVYLLSDGSACHPFQEGYDMRNDVLNFARAVLARWGNRQGSLTSSPPADGEVAELVETLKGIAYWKRHGKPGEPAPASFDIRQADRLNRAAELLERQAPVAVSERPWELKGWCDPGGLCWLGSDAIDCTPTWLYGPPAWAERFPNVHRVLLPAHALPLPEVGE